LRSLQLGEARYSLRTEVSIKCVHEGKEDEDRGSTGGGTGHIIVCKVHLGMQLTSSAAGGGTVAGGGTSRFLGVQRKSLVSRTKRGGGTRTEKDRNRRCGSSPGGLHGCSEEESALRGEHRADRQESKMPKGGKRGSQAHYKPHLRLEGYQVQGGRPCGSPREKALLRPATVRGESARGVVRIVRN